MKILLWNIRINEYSLAKLQWTIYKTTGIKPKYDCGRTKKSKYLCCSQPMDIERSYVINDGDTHEVRCKCCGGIKMMSSKEISVKNEEIWFEF